MALPTTHSDNSLEKGGDANRSAHTDDDVTKADDSDADALDEPMTFHRIMSFVAMAFLWTSSQIPLYLFGAIPPIIYGDIGGADRWIWFVLANLLALAAVCPFVGSLSDLMGRRYVAIMGAGFIVLGMIVASTAHNMNTFICGMAFAGIGGGICELTALAVTSELAPVSKRGTYNSALVLTILPFTPAVLWAQLISSHASWRYCGLLCGVWAFLGLSITAVFYFPPPRVNSQGLTSREVLAKIDYVGGFLSIFGMILFMAGLQWGGYQYPWKSAHVLAPLLIGAAMIIAFFLWEAYGATHPMFPARLKQDPRILILTLVITFISGANFFSVLLFWPTQAFNVYGHDPVAVGVRGLPMALGILFGACAVLYLLSALKGHNKELLIASSVLMTAGCGAMAVATPHNMHAVYGILFVAGVGIGGIVVPASIITTIICPDDLIGTIAAFTLAIRVIGGSIGYTIYYNVFINKFVPKVTTLVGGALLEAGVTNMTVVVEGVTLTGASLIDDILYLPGIDGNVTKWESVVAAGQLAFADSYAYVYYASIAFGSVAILASCFLGDIRKYMDNHVAVVIR